MGYKVIYNYVGEDYPDVCCAVVDVFETLEEAVERKEELKECECYTNIVIVTPEYLL